MTSAPLAAQVCEIARDERLATAKALAARRRDEREHVGVPRREARRCRDARGRVDVHDEHPRRPVRGVLVVDEVVVS